MASFSRSAWPGFVPSPLVSQSSTGNTAVARGSLASAAAPRGTIATKDASRTNAATLRITGTSAQKSPALEKTKMFIAMNRFKVTKEECNTFEDVWLTRDARLGAVKGFVAFHLLRGPERGDHVHYSSHTIWATQEDSGAWTKSGRFRAARQRAGEHKPLTPGIQSSKGSKSSRRSKIPIRPGSRSSTRGNGLAASGEIMIAGARLRAPWLSGLLRPCPNGS